MSLSCPVLFLYRHPVPLSVRVRVVGRGQVRPLGSRDYARREMIETGWSMLPVGTPAANGNVAVVLVRRADEIRARLVVAAVARCRMQ